MSELQVGKTYIIQALSANLENVILYQDQTITILEIKNGKVTYRYNENDKVYTHDYFGIRYIV